MSETTLAAPETAVPVHELLSRVIEMRGSDLHLMAGSPPLVRVHGELVRLDEYGPIPPQTLRETVYGVLPQKMRERFEQDLELDTSYSLPGRARFRLNVYRQRDSVGAVFRLIPSEIMSVDGPGLPPVVSELARFPRGLVVVTGPTGSGKSTTLAAMVNVVNEERAAHIMTVEDPIEFLHTNKRSAVNQREVGNDTHGFAEATKHVLRQDPDVIMIGEMRDLETISTAITAAETGHLVFATLHTQDAAADDRPHDRRVPLRAAAAGARAALHDPAGRGEPAAGAHVRRQRPRGGRGGPRGHARHPRDDP